MAYNQFPPVNVPTSGCGAPGALPAVAVYQPEVACPGAGVGASTFVSPAAPIGIGLGVPIARFRFSSTTETNLFFGRLPASCNTFLQDHLGIEIFNICDVALSQNTQAEQLCCLWDTFTQTIIGIVAKTSDAIDSLNAVQVLFDACNPCFTSDVEFICSNGCNQNSNFILTNAVAGANAGLIVTVPASVNITFDICSCAPEVRQFASCPVSVPAVAAIPAQPVCPPLAPAAGVYGNGFANGNGAFAALNGNNGFNGR